MIVDYITIFCGICFQNRMEKKSAGPHQLDQDDSLNFWRGLVKIKLTRIQNNKSQLQVQENSMSFR